MVKRNISLPVLAEHFVRDQVVVVPPSSKPSSDVVATTEQRAEVIAALNHLSVAYGLNFTKLTRMLGLTTDVKRVLETHKQVTNSHLTEIATLLGLSLAELRAVRKLPLYRSDALRRRLREQDLLRGW